MKVRHSLAVQLEDVAALSSSGNSDVRLAVERGHVDLSAKSRLTERYRHFADDIIAVSLEDVVGFDANVAVEVAARRSDVAGVTLALYHQALPVSYAWGNAQLHGRASLVVPGAVTRGTRVCDNAAGAAAIGTCLLHQEETALLADHARSVAIRTARGAGAGLGAASPAGFAEVVSSDLDRLCMAAGRLLE